MTEEKKSLEYNEVQLKDGRIVKLREAKGSDNMIIAAELGPVLEPNAGSALILLDAQIAKTIVSIDNKPTEPLRNYEKYRDLLDMFSGRDWKRITAKYNEINGDEGN